MLLLLVQHGRDTGPLGGTQSKAETLEEFQAGEFHGKRIGADLGEGVQSCPGRHLGWETIGGHCDSQLRDTSLRRGNKIRTRLAGT